MVLGRQACRELRTVRRGANEDADDSRSFQMEDLDQVCPETVPDCFERC